MVDMGAYEFSTQEPFIFMSDNNVNITALEARENPSPYAITLNNFGLADLNWMASSNVNWLDVNPNTGSINYEQTASVDIVTDVSGLTAGEYQGQITFSDLQAINNPQVVDVNLIIIGPSLGISQTDYSFTASKQTLNPEPQILTISNLTEGGTLLWSITPDCNWINIEPATGAVMTGSMDVMLDIDQDNIEYGNHSCQLTVKAANAANSPQTVTVNLDVLPSEFGLSQTSFSFTSESMSNPPASQVLAISNTGYDMLDWTITGADSCDWLAVVPESGQTDSGTSTDVSFSVNPVIAGYGLHSCELTISDLNASNSPQVVTVTLDVLRPEIGVLPESISFEWDVDEPNVLTDVLSISNSGYDVMNWQVSEDCEWLSVEPLSGQCTTEPNNMTLSVNTEGLEIGFYTCELTIMDDNASNSPVTVPVSLHVYRDGERHVPTEYPTIQQAIDAAVDGDHVIIHPGRYTGVGNGDISLLGKEITVRSLDPTNPEIVAGTIISSLPNYSVFVFSDADYQNAVIDGLTIADISLSFYEQHAGVAINSNYANSPLVRNCVFRNLRGPAVVYGYASTMVFENCQFINNELGVSTVMSGSHQSLDGLYLNNCLIAGNVFPAYDQQYGARCIYIYNVPLYMDNCTVAYNQSWSSLEGYWTSFPGIMSVGGTVSVTNSIVWGNTTISENDEYRQIVIAPNPELPEPLSEPWISISHSDIQYDKEQVLLFPDYSSFTVYMETRQLPDPNLIDPNWIQLGAGNIDVDPVFVREPNDGGDGWFDDWETPDVDESANNIFGDYHLKSQAGRFVWDGFARADFNLDKQVDLIDFAELAQNWRLNWTVPIQLPCNLYWDEMIDLKDFALFCDDYLQPRVFGAWVSDAVTSPCIDAGDPNDTDWQNELWPHGRRINMGAYGGTAAASLSTNDVGNPADLNHDDAVDLIDWSLWADDWGDERILLDSDFDRDNIVDPNDMTIFMNNWLWME
ncbi:MAG: hypothetical protein DRP56_08405 [Planctomycetota bacterium]|nr:MAG: hypothetical protein DRP56_08405 [Planctomycetota bacterium]